MIRAQMNFSLEGFKEKKSAKLCKTLAQKKILQRELLYKFVHSSISVTQGYNESLICFQSFLKSIKGDYEMQMSRQILHMNGFKERLLPSVSYFAKGKAQVLLERTETLQFKFKTILDKGMGMMPSYLEEPLFETRENQNYHDIVKQRQNLKALGAKVLGSVLQKPNL